MIFIFMKVYGAWEAQIGRVWFHLRHPRLWRKSGIGFIRITNDEDNKNTMLKRHPIIVALIVLAVVLLIAFVASMTTPRRALAALVLNPPVQYGAKSYVPKETKKPDAPRIQKSTDEQRQIDELYRELYRLIALLNALKNK